MKNILFIIQNNPIYLDTRVKNEAFAVIKNLNSKVIMLSPRGHDKEKIKNFRFQGLTTYFYPNFEAKSIYTQLIEYVLSAFSIFIYSYYLIFRYRIKIVHIANPPDFLVFLMIPAKIFGTVLIFDQHDLSIEAFNAKLAGRKWDNGLIVSILKVLESISYKYSNAIIFANENFYNYYKNLNYNKSKPSCIVRNGVKLENIFRIANNEEIKAKKLNAETISLCYIGIITKESGIFNLITIADQLKSAQMLFKFHVFGNGSHFEDFKYEIRTAGLENEFIFYGFKPIENILQMAYDYHIGIVPLPDISKNNIHTSSKVIDYMSVGLPVFSLNLDEQISVAQNGGVYFNTFEEMSTKIIEYSKDLNALFQIGVYGQERFLKYYRWELQEKKLVELYDKFI